jgi:hypothetical protein
MLVFAGLWGHCDKAGRFEWKPRHLKLDILPFLPFEMAQTLELLEAHGFIKRYSVAGKEYGCIPSFSEHQRIGGKEAQEPGKHPEPPETTSEETVKHKGSNGEAVGIAGREGKGREKEGNGIAGSRKNGAHHESFDDSPILQNLPLREGGDFPVRQSLVAELEPLYPAVDIPATLKEMKGWLVLNAERRKTKRGVRRFICNWLQSEQEKHGG